MVAHMAHNHGVGGSSPPAANLARSFPLTSQVHLPGHGKQFREDRMGPNTMQRIQPARQVGAGRA